MLAVRQLKYSQVISLNTKKATGIALKLESNYASGRVRKPRQAVNAVFHISSGKGRAVENRK